MLNYSLTQLSEPASTPFYRRAVSFLGLLIMLFLAWSMSSARFKMNWRLIISGVILQIIFGILVLWTTPGAWFFEGARYLIDKIIKFSDEGAKFVFGAGFKEHFFAFSVLPTIIFVSSMMSVLFYLGIVQHIVKGMAWVMVKIMDVSGSESLASAANVFVGQTEAPLVILPYIKTMTRSELMALMVGGMATVAGGVMAAYAAMGADAGHLLSASIMSAPAALVIAKIMIPERESSLTKGIVKVEVEKPGENVLDAACAGASGGLKLAVNVAAMLIAFTALIYLANWVLCGIGDLFGFALSLQMILGWIFSPLAWIMGVEGKDIMLVGQTIGEKTILNEFYAYTTLVSDKVQPHISERSFTIATYALCGFANFASIAIQIGGIGALVPERRKDLAKLGLRAMIGGTLAAFMTACIAGMLIK
ncbi:MAG: NupC/NupG family nucleoside CNT transporter [Planctomycetes bacterium]|nr:NupC/NupG family nucleoside CNT transporter [Planctomycetota bacterium]